MGVVGPPHTRLIDGPKGTPIEELVPGIDRRITLSGHPFIYGVRAIKEPDGPRVVELHITAPDYDVPIRPNDLRDLAKVLDRIAYAATGLIDPSERGFPTPEKKRPGRHGRGDAFYAEVAEVAKTAHRDRRNGDSEVSVRRAIAAKYGVNVGTADKYLARARKAGHLQPGELGGKPKPRKGTGG